MLLMSCRSSMTDIDAFEVVTEITDYDSLFSDKETPLGVIVNLEVRNGIIVTEHGNDEYNFSFIDASTGNLLKRWGKRGEGDNEFIDFGNGFVLTDSLLIFQERMRKMICSVSVTDILDEGRASIATKESYPYTVDFRPLIFNIVNGKKIFAGCFKTGRLGVINSRNEIMECPFEYPFYTEPLAGVMRGSVFQCKIKSNEKQRKTIVQTLASDVFEIYQCSDTALSRIYVSPFNNPPKLRKSGNRYGIDYDESIAGLMKMAVSDDFIYFTYSSLRSNEKERLGNSVNEILCFNWNGEKVRKYLLPIPITSFCADKQYIYGICNNEEETIIYRFKL